MATAFTLPHGIVAPVVQSSPLVTYATAIGIGLFTLLILWLALRMRKKHNLKNKQKLTPFNQWALGEVTDIFSQSTTDHLSSEQRYALWRLLRKIGIHYFGTHMATASAAEFVSQCFRSQEASAKSDNTSSFNEPSDTTSAPEQSNETQSKLETSIVTLNASLYNPNVLISNTPLQSMLVDWITNELNINAPTHPLPNTSAAP